MIQTMKLLGEINNFYFLNLEIEDIGGKNHGNMGSAYKSCRKFN